MPDILKGNNNLFNSQLFSNLTIDTLACIRNKDDAGICTAIEELPLEIQILVFVHLFRLSHTTSDVIGLIDPHWFDENTDTETYSPLLLILSDLLRKIVINIGGKQHLDFKTRMRLLFSECVKLATDISCYVDYEMKFLDQQGCLSKVSKVLIRSTGLDSPLLCNLTNVTSLGIDFRNPVLTWQTVENVVIMMKQLRLTAKNLSEISVKDLRVATESLNLDAIFINSDVSINLELSAGLFFPSSPIPFTYFIGE
ncbi:unnamed protein product [Ambrosiozyma monospora]|uniref:Unnamed protein product n=1 Tax=Ambrosiozyma monospora TaxID=43982 RepID=A0ACB5STP8_AMBMO|nr:unnamed protein product [Ambrosiozyma monospora]